MEKIYFAAEMVFVWLGTCANDSDLAMSQMSSLNKGLAAAAAAQREQVKAHTLQIFGLPSLDDPVWLAVVQLYLRDWFSRLWIVQEVVLAKAIRVLCGDLHVEWDMFARFATRLREFPLLADLLESCQIFDLLLGLPDPGLGVAPLLEILRSSMANDFDIGTYTMGIARQKLTKEPVDKVYGVLGLMEEQQRSLIKVDYSPKAREEYWNVYMHVFKLLLDSHGPHVLTMTSSESRCLELPSWRPDFRSARSTNIFGQSYSAGAVLDAWDIEQPSPHSWGLRPEELKLRGLIMDRVGHVLCLPWKALRSGWDVKNIVPVLQCEEACSHLSKQMYGSSGDVPEEHMITLVAGMTVNRDEYPTQQLVEDYGNTIRTYHSLSAGSICHDEVDEVAFASVGRYQGAMMEYWKRSCFFTTQRGRIGIGPDTIEPGDAVVVIFEADTPFILRPDTQGSAYRLHGVAYVHGLMDGESFTASQPARTYEEFFVL